MLESVSGWEVVKTITSALVPIILFVFGGVWSRWSAAKKIEETEKRVAAKELTDTVRLVVTELRDLKESTKSMNVHLMDKIAETSSHVVRLEAIVTNNYNELKLDIKDTNARIDHKEKPF